MRLYEIDAAITALVDPETGEIMDYEAFLALNMERDKKLENMAIWYKDLCAEAKAIREEEINLAARRKANENKAERLKTFLGEMLAGQQFKTPRVALSFRSSEAVEIADEATLAKVLEAEGRTDLLTYKAPTVNKTAIKEALKNGWAIEGAEIVTRSNIQIK